MLVGGGFKVRSYFGLVFSRASRESFRGMVMLSMVSGWCCIGCFFVVGVYFVVSKVLVLNCVVIVF